MYNSMQPMNTMNMTPQQRLQAYEAQYPQFGQTMQPMMPSQPMMQQPMQMPQQQGQQTQGQFPPNIKCRMVTSEEEARAAMIDFDGSPHVFTDLNNNKIYVKKIGLNGSAEFLVFLDQRLLQQPQQMQPMQMQQAPAQPAIDIEELKQGFVPTNDFQSFKQDVYNKLNKVSEMLSTFDRVLGGSGNE